MLGSTGSNIVQKYSRVIDTADTEQKMAFIQQLLVPVVTVMTCILYTVWVYHDNVTQIGGESDERAR